MAFITTFLSQPLPHSTGHCKAIPQQLISLSSPQPLTCRHQVRTSVGTAAAAGVAVPLPGPRVSPAQVGRALLRTTSTGLSDSAEMIKRTLSGKITKGCEAVLQVVVNAAPQRVLFRNRTFFRPIATVVVTCVKTCDH